MENQKNSEVHLTPRRNFYDFNKQAKNKIVDDLAKVLAEYNLTLAECKEVISVLSIQLENIRLWDYR